MRRPAARSYDTSNETWGAFSEPVIWANWGHSGEDGDGIEYIYYLCDEKNKNVLEYLLKRGLKVKTIKASFLL